MIVLTTTKHLAGKHDQKTHGRGGTSAGAVGIPSAADRGMARSFDAVGTPTQGEITIAGTAPKRTPEGHVELLKPAEAKARYGTTPEEAETYLRSQGVDVTIDRSVRPQVDPAAFYGTVQAIEDLHGSFAADSVRAGTSPPKFHIVGYEMDNIGQYSANVADPTSRTITVSPRSIQILARGDGVMPSVFGGLTESGQRRTAQEIRSGLVVTGRQPGPVSAQRLGYGVVAHEYGHHLDHVTADKRNRGGAKLVLEHFGAQNTGGANWRSTDNQAEFIAETFASAFLFGDAGSRWTMEDAKGVVVKAEHGCAFGPGSVAWAFAAAGSAMPPITVDVLAEEPDVEKHLAGKHDQKTHGRGGGAALSAAQAAALAGDAADTEAALDGTHHRHFHIDDDPVWTYAMAEPSMQRSAANREAFARRSPEHAALADEINRWSDPDSADVDDVRARVKAGDPSAIVLDAAVRNAPPSTVPLYRGLTLSDADYQRVAALKPGDLVEDGSRIVSFTADMNTSRHFTTGPDDNGVLLTVPARSAPRALNITGLSGIPPQQERLVAQKLRVAEVDFTPPDNYDPKGWDGRPWRVELILEAVDDPVAKSTVELFADLGKPLRVTNPLRGTAVVKYNPYRDALGRYASGPGSRNLRPPAGPAGAQQATATAKDLHTVGRSIPDPVDNWFSDDPVDVLAETTRNRAEFAARSPQHAAVAAGVFAWTGRDSDVNRVRAAIDKGEPNAVWFHETVKHAPPTDRPLYRGMRAATPAQQQAFDRLQPGDTIPAGRHMASFTPRQAHAETFRGTPDDMGMTGGGILLQLAPGARALDITGISRTPVEQEHLVAGSLRVLSSARRADGTRVVTVAHLPD